MLLLQSMTCREMFDEIAADYQKIKIRISKMHPRVVKIFKRSKKFPNWYVDEYKIPATNNHYIIFYYAGNINKTEQPHYTVFCITFNENQRFVINPLQVPYKHTPYSEIINMPQLHVYTSHFFRRYNERFLHKKELTANEIAGLYFIRNRRSHVPIDMNEEINRNFKKYGKFNDKAMRVPDGLCFTRFIYECKVNSNDTQENEKPDANLVLYTTFINESDMSNSQRDAIDKEHFETFKRFMEEMGQMNLH